jgi:RNA polymerase sigma factor (sigma-70 family)
MSKGAELPATSASLLGRLCDAADVEAWSEFVDRYVPGIYIWCRRWHLQEADAQDVSQEVLLKLVRQLRAFQYDSARCFRGLLYTVTRNVLCDMLKGRQRAGQVGADSQVEKLLDNEEAREDLAKRLEDEFDKELLELAMQRVRLRVKPTTWEAFRLVAIEGLSAEEAAARLGARDGTVRVHRARVAAMLHEEVAKLDRSVAE